MPNLQTSNPDVITELKNIYSDFRNLTPDMVRSVYASDIKFKDPIHEISGIDLMIEYFQNLDKGLNSCRFEFNDELINENKAFLNWQMSFSHSALNRGERINLSGASLLKFEDKIYFHEDYYDMGSMVYEHVPVLSAAIKYIKSRLQR